MAYAHGVTHWNLYSGVTPTHQDCPTGRHTDTHAADEELTKKQVLERRIAMLDNLIDTYRSEYWLLGEELLCLKNRSQGNDLSDDGNSESICELFKKKSTEECLPHAARLQQFVKDLPEGTLSRVGPKDLSMAKQGLLDTRMKEISRLEMSSHAALSREMNAHGALAMLCGMNNTYFIRSHIVSIGRNNSNGSTSLEEKVDIDISEEAALCGNEKTISRLQAKIFKDTDGACRIQNCSHSRPLNVDGTILHKGDIIRLYNMSIISVAGVSLLFITHAQG